MTLKTQNHHSLRRNPASLIPQEQLTLNASSFHNVESACAVFCLQYIVLDVAFPEPFYEYGLFTKSIIREAPPITISM